MRELVGTMKDETFSTHGFPSMIKPDSIAIKPENFYITDISRAIIRLSYLNDSHCDVSQCEYIRKRAQLPCRKIFRLFGIDGNTVVARTILAQRVI